MTYNFDKIIPRRHTESAKWQWYGEDVLPMWVADMDFRSPEPVIQALQDRIQHGIFGYGLPPDELSAVICDRMARLYNWTVTPDDIILLPGVVTGFNVVCRAMAQPGEGVLVQTPVYPPFLSAPANHEQILQTVDLTLIEKGNTIRYEMDFDRFEATITPQSRVFILCHPHNPTGISLTPAELSRLADICARHNIVLCSDEIHCDLLLDGTKHTPTASISPEISANCITLMAPSKTFNIPGLGCSFAIVQNPELKKKLEAARAGIVPWVNVMGLVAAQVAYEEGQGWLTELLKYLTENRNLTVDYITKHLPTVRTTVPQATYLAWLDCRQSGIEGSPYKFFLEKAKVALNNGATFGKAGEGFVRLNFGCPRATLMQGLEQMSQALKEIG